MQVQVLIAGDIIQGQIICNTILFFLFQKITIPIHTASKHCNKEIVVPMWSGNFSSCKVSPGIAAPHLSVTPEENDEDFGNLGTNSCAFPALPQRLFCTVLMPWPGTTSTASHLLKADPFLGDKKRKKAQDYQGVSMLSFVGRVTDYRLSGNLSKNTCSS